MVWPIGLALYKILAKVLSMILSLVFRIPSFLVQVPLSRDVNFGCCFGIQ